MSITVIAYGLGQCLRQPSCPSSIALSFFAIPTMVARWQWPLFVANTAFPSILMLLKRNTSVFIEGKTSFYNATYVQTHTEATAWQKIRHTHMMPKPLLSVNKNSNVHSFALASHKIHEWSASVWVGKHPHPHNRLDNVSFTFICDKGQLEYTFLHGHRPIRSTHLMPINW